MANNPIELLISLAVNTARSKDNIDDNLKALKKYYDKNPLLLNVDFDRTKALSNLQSFVKEASKQAINLDLNLKGDDLSKVKSQAQQLKDEFAKVEKIVNGKRKSSASFDLDLDRVLVQLDNMGRKGIVATGQIAKFQAQIEALRGTNDRLSLKATTTDMFNVASGAKHADTVIEGLNQSLIKIGASQQKLSGIKDKFNIDPHASDEYKRLEGVVESLTADIIRLQTQATSGGSDQIKLSQQMRDIQQRIQEATREMNAFSNATKNENAFAKLQKDAQNMVKELTKTGQVSNQVIGNFQRDMAVIAASSDSSVTKLNRLTQAMDSLKQHSTGIKMDNKFEDKVDSQILAVDKLEAKITRIGTIHKNTVDKMEFRRLTDEARKLAEQLTRVETGADLRGVTKRYKELSGEVDKLGANAVTAAKASRGLVDTLGEAFRKFPVWAGMAALIYTPIRGIQDLIDKVVELDTALVQLQRVMDAPSYVFDDVLQSMIRNVDELSGKTADYMQMVGDFARTGLDENQSQEYANVATILQNISELTPEETINVLTASMTAFGEETEGVLRIADRLNEIDNNFAITTRDLGLALNKTASSAKVYGVSLDEVLGYTTAIGVATRESGNIVGNSLKTIFARMTTNSSAINALKDVGISITNQAGEVRAVSEIIDELAGKWDGLSKAQQQNTSVGIAGMNQQNRFNALMLNYGMAVDATQASINSQNSAMREQLIYSESLQARINRLQNAWYGFADAMGQSVLYDGIVVITSLLQAVTDGAGGLVSSMGALAPLLGVVGIALMVFSKNMRALVGSMTAQASAAYASSTATSIFGRAAAGASGAVKALNISVKSLMATLGVGLVFMAVGFAIEKMFNVISEGIQQTEKYNQFVEQNTAAMGKNRESTEELIKKFKELNAQKEYNSNAWSSENEQEYLQVQTQLAEVFPGLVDHIDASGQAYIKNAAAIDEVVKSTDKMLVQAEKAKLAAAEDDFNKMFESLSGKWYQSISNFVYGSLEDRIKQTKQIIEAMQKDGTDTSKQEYELMQLEAQASEAAQKIKGHMFEIADAYAIVQKMEIDPNVQKSLESFVQSLDLSNLDASQLKQFGQDFAEIAAEISRAADAGNAKGYDEAIKKLNDLAGRAKNGKDDFKKFGVSYDDFIKAIKKGQAPIVDAEGNIEDLTEATGALIDTNYDYKDSAEAMAGVTQKQIDDTKDLLTQYEFLGYQLAGHTEEELKALETKKFLTGEERVLLKAYQERGTIMEQLLAIYPNLLDADGKSITMTEEKIKAIQKEQEAQEILLKATQLAKDGKLSAEQAATVAAAAGTQARIDFLKQEINMLSKYMKANSLAAKIAGAMSGIAGLGLTAQQMAAQQALEGYQKELDGLQSQLDSSLNNIKGFSDAITDSGKASSKANKETEKSIYITDKYKKAMDELSLSIERQQALREEAISGSNKSRLALAEEIKLTEKQLKLMKDQEAAIRKQISTGKIQQTGNVKQSQTVAAGQKIGGAFDGKITSTYGSRADNHRGVDFAASRGTAINSPVSGKVIKAGDAKSQGMHWSYGNLVVVQDDSGVKHIMAHMDKVMAKVGDQIVAGIQVGTVGSTGNSTGNHLHYEQNSANGKVLNPNATVDAIRNGTLTTAGGTSVVGVSSGAEDIDKAGADLVQIQKDTIALEKRLNELRALMVSEVLQNYENKKNAYDRTLQNVENNMKKLSEASEAYRFELDKQGKALLDKRKVNQEELIYLQNVISKGKLSDKALGELQDRLQELKNENAQIDFAINDNYLAKIASLNAMLEETVAKYDKIRDAQDRTIAYQTAQLRELDSTSKEYAKALVNINEEMKKKQAANRQELADTTRLINNGKYYGEALTNAKLRVQDLQLQIKELQLEIQEGNFEILINIKNDSDETVKDIEYEKSRLEEIRKMYEEGSGDYLKYTAALIEQQKKLADQHEKTRDALKAELKQQDISKDRIREIKRLLEAEHLAYLQATNAVKDYTNQLEKANESRKEDIANKVIAALKNAIQEVRDEHLKAIDETIKKETDAHNLRLKNLKDEQDLFRKNVEERLKLIDRQEAERGYNMEIDELEKERSKVQERMFTISNDNSYAAKKERKQLQEQLDRIDKDIAEKRHQRDIELQKQGLGDLLEMKEQEIEGKIELENEAFDETVDRLNREKAYYEKHYNDLLNDERKFAQMREDIMKGNFAAIEAEFKGYIDRLSATMPQLADTMNGTMQAVGMMLRQNVIDELQRAIDAMKEFKELTESVSNSFNDGFTTGIGGGESGSAGGGSTSQGNLSGGDMKVLMGKFLYDNVAPALSGSAQTSARNTGRQMGQSGYKEGSSIDEGLNFGSAMAGLTPAEIESFKKYLQQNMGMNGGAYDKYFQQFIGGNGDISNTTNRFGVKTPMSYGDMQVMMAKYMREMLISPNSPQALKNEIIPQADQMAASGRSAGSVVSSDVTYGAVLASLDKAQRAQFKSFLSNQSGIIKNQDLKNKAKNYAASLYEGGMLNNRATSGGVDGIGGEWFIGHKGEVVNNPVQTDQLLATVDSSRVMLQHLASIIRPLSNIFEAMGGTSSVGGSSDEYNFIFQGDYINMNEQMLRRMAGGAMDEVRTRQGITGNSYGRRL